MNTLPVRNVDRRSAEAVETLGSKPKFWFREGETRFLFKAEDRGTGEDWAEVVACRLCCLLGLPHVEYELAAEHDGGRCIRPGVICENMAPPPLALVLGNQLLLERDPDYPTGQRFKVRQHTVEAVARAVEALKPPSAMWMSTVPAGVESALDVFVGYIMLDTWIANQDRHHENWGALRVDELRLAPTFDHGAALGRNLTDDEREERLTTKDRNRTVAAFAARGRSAFYGSMRDRQPLGLLEAFRSFADRAPDARSGWLERLGSVNRGALLRILEEVPTERMSDICREFTLELLLTNQERLLQEGTP